MSKLIKTLSIVLAGIVGGLLIWTQLYPTGYNHNDNGMKLLEEVVVKRNEKILLKSVENFHGKILRLEGYDKDKPIQVHYTKTGKGKSTGIGTYYFEYKTWGGKIYEPDDKKSTSVMQELRQSKSSGVVVIEPSKTEFANTFCSLNGGYSDDCWIMGRLNAVLVIALIEDEADESMEIYRTQK